MQKRKYKRMRTPLEVWLQDVIERMFDKFMVRRDAIVSSGVMLGCLALLGYYFAAVSLWMKSPYEFVWIALMLMMHGVNRRPAQ